jgi:hypothetical protein
MKEIRAYLEPFMLSMSDSGNYRTILFVANSKRARTSSAHPLTFYKAV